MADEPVYIAEGTPAATSVGVDVVVRPSPSNTTTTTGDPGVGGTTLAVTANAKFPATNNYKVRVIGTSGVAEVMLVTAGAGTNSWTVTRGQDGTTGVAHSVGATVSLMVGVQRVEPADASKIVTYKGRASTFRTPGLAGTTGQKLLALHNATGSTVLVDVERITVDLHQTVIKAVTVAPPFIRVHRFTAVPTGGAALGKVAEDTALASNSALTAWQGASADGTGVALNVTIPAANMITQEQAPRLITAAGYEPSDRIEFFAGEGNFITLRALEGVVLNLDYTLATQNPITDMWSAALRWSEYRTT